MYVSECVKKRIATLAGNMPENASPLEGPVTTAQIGIPIPSVIKWQIHQRLGSEMMRGVSNLSRLKRNGTKPEWNETGMEAWGGGEFQGNSIANIGEGIPLRIRTLPCIVKILYMPGC